MPKRTIDESRLVTGLLQGDSRTLRVFYDTFQPKLMAYVKTRVKTREDAEEIVQDSLIGFLDALPLFRKRSSVWTFLVSIAKHEIADYFRRLYAKKAIKYVPFLDQVYTKPVYSSKETAEVFRQALKKLKPTERKLIIWKYDHKLSVKEIADKMGVGVKAVESRLFRARQSFKLAYAELDQSYDY